MNPVSAHVLSWLLGTTLQVAVLTGLLLLVNRLFRRFLSPGWQHALWLLALVPLVCPVLPTSPWSPLHLLRSTWLDNRDDAGQPMEVTVSEATVLRPTMTSPSPTLAETPQSSLARGNLSTILVALWALGVVALVLRQPRVARQFRQQVRQGQPVTEPAVLAELASCQEMLKLHRDVRLLETEAVGSPALAGVWRPAILLPVGLLAKLSAAERQCLFLHELAHVKRCDLAVDALAGVCQVLYWFNPLVHLVAARLRTTRELACDAHVLGTRRGEDALYARTLLKLATQASSFRVLPALAGMAERTSSIEARLRSINQFRPAKWRHAWGSILLALVAAIGLSRAGDPPKPGTEPATVPAAPPPEAPVTVAKTDEPQITIASQFIELRADTPEALQAMVGQLVPTGVEHIDGDATKRAGIVSTTEMTAMLAALERLGADVLSSPKVTTLSGQIVILRMIEERYFPTGWSRLDENGNPNRKKDPDGNPLPVPIFGDSTDIGCILEATPQLVGDRKSVDLEATARVVEDVGWEDTKVKDTRDPGTEFVVPKEVLRIRLASARLAVPVGSSTCLVSNIVPDETAWEDRVPILGDIPLVGRLFRSTGKTTYAKALVVLITPTLVHSDGTPFEPTQELKNTDKQD